MFQISDELYSKFQEVYQSASEEEKSAMVHPDVARNSPNFFIAESLQKVIKVVAKGDRERRELFMDAHGLIISGQNPFKDAVVRKAGVDLKMWKEAVKYMRTL